MAGKFILGMISGALVVTSVLVLGSALSPPRPANVASPATQPDPAPEPVQAESDPAALPETTAPADATVTEASPTTPPPAEPAAIEVAQPAEPASPPEVEAVAVAPEAAQPEAPLATEVARPETPPEPSKPAETLADSSVAAPAAPEPPPETLLAQADVQDVPLEPSATEQASEPPPVEPVADPEPGQSEPALAADPDATPPPPASATDPAPSTMAEATEAPPAAEMADPETPALDNPGLDASGSGDLAVEQPLPEPMPDETGPLPSDATLPGDAVPDLPGTPAEALPGAPEPEAPPAPETANRGSTFKPAPGLPRAGDAEGGAGSAPDEAAPADPEATPDDPRPIARFAAAFDNPAGKPAFAIVLIDDGSDGVDRAGLATLPFPASIALDPLDPASAERAAAYRAAGKEVVMQATGIAEGAQPSDVEVAFQSMEQGLPDAVAVMDLAEPGFQNKRLLASTVVPILKSQGRGLLTWDTGLNAADQVARREDLEAAVIFRDLGSVGQDRAAIRRLLDRAVFKAGQEGRVSVVGRADPATVAALLEWSIEGKAATVALAPLTAVLRVD